MPPPAADAALVARLVALDSTVFSDIAAAFLGPLVAFLRRSHPRADEHLLFTAAEDAVISLLKNPKAFDPARGSLLGFLRMAARGDHHRRRSQLQTVLARSVPVRDLDLVAAREQVDGAVGAVDGKDAIADVEFLVEEVHRDDGAGGWAGQRAGDFAETGEHSRSADGHEAKERNGEPARKQCGVFHRKSPGRSMGTILPRLVAALASTTPVRTAESTM